MPAARVPTFDSESSPSWRGWQVVTSSFLGVMLGYSVLVPYTFSLFIKPLGQQFGWRRDQIALGMSCVAITVALCSALIGWSIDRLGAKRVVIPCVLLFGAAFASLSLLTANIAQFYLTFVLLGIAGNGTTQLAYSRAVCSWFTRRRGLALSLVSAGAGVGAMLVPLLASWMIQQRGWRWAYATLGGLVILVSLPCLLFLFREAPENGRQSAREDRTPAHGLAESQVPFAMLVLAILLYSITFNGVISHLAAMMTDRGYTAAMAAEVLSVIGLCGLAGRLLTGFLLDRISATRLSMALFLATVASLCLLVAGSAAAVFSSAALLGFAAGGESDITPYLLSRYYRLRSFAVRYGCAWMAFATGTAIGPLLMGELYRRTGSYPAWGVELLAAPTLASALLMALMPRYPTATGEAAPRNDIPILATDANHRAYDAECP